MTFVTTYALSCGMVSVAENRLENVSAGRRAIVRGKFMADIARTDLALGRMTSVTIHMCLEADGDRHSPARRSVT